MPYFAIFVDERKRRLIFYLHIKRENKNTWWMFLTYDKISKYSINWILMWICLIHNSGEDEVMQNTICKINFKLIRMTAGVHFVQSAHRYLGAVGLRAGFQLILCVLLLVQKLMHPRLIARCGEIKIMCTSSLHCRCAGDANPQQTTAECRLIQRRPPFL